MVMLDCLPNGVCDALIKGLASLQYAQCIDYTRLIASLAGYLLNTYLGVSNCYRNNEIWVICNLYFYVKHKHGRERTRQPR